MNRIRIPYGLSDYKQIKTEKYMYVDKTKYIQELENLNTRFPVFLRPRRFGKSLLVSTLFYYYDINSLDEFETLFGDTYIGARKTVLANQYYVLRFDFSGLDTENEEQLRKAFYWKIETALKRFIRYYKLDVEIQGNDSFNSASMLNDVLTSLQELMGKKVYIMIDEYDQFANNIVGNQAFFTSVTSKDGFVRNFYEVFKTHAGDGCIDRIFITGVTSMTLDSLTSGFNIARNVSMLQILNDMAGFTEDETRKLLYSINIEDVERTMALLVEHYNGYLFHKQPGAAERVLNSNLVLYFLDEYQLQGDIPHTMIDSNIRSDYLKLTGIFELFTNKVRRTQILQDIMEGNSVNANIVSDFTFSDTFNQHEFLSMLYYLGLLTIKGDGGIYDVALEPPNMVIRDVYYKYYADYLNIDEENKLDALGAIAYENNFEKFNRIVEKVLQMHSNDDFRGFDEARLKSVFLSCFSNQNVYLVKSEYESSGKKIDIALFDIRDGKTSVKYNYLIELKYLKKSDSEEERINGIKQEAYTQMKSYMNLSEFQYESRIKGLIYVVVKDKIVCFEEVRKH